MTEPPDAARRTPWHHLGVRFGLILCLGVAAIFLAMGAWNVATQRSHMIRLTGQAADRTAALIRSATREGMLRDEMTLVRRVLDTMGGMPGIDRIRILDRAGKVHSSTRAEDVGEVVPFSAFQCRACHLGEAALRDPDHDDLRQSTEDGRGRRLLDVIAPIYNEPDCHTADCHAHSPEQSVLGIIDVQMPLDSVDALIQDSERQLGVGLAATLLAVTGLTVFLAWRMVLRPVQVLAQATERVGAGDFSARVEVRSQDEMGRLARSWNVMVGDLRKARGELEEWSRTLEERVEQKTRELEAAHQRMLVVEKMAALGKLAAVVAHEINNPLAGIATYARLMRKRCEQGLPGDVESAKALELMETEAARCGRIVRNLLLFSRTPGARFVEEDLGPVLERCAMLVRHQADLQGVEIRVQVASDAPRVVCDASQVQQVVLALTMNAIEAMPRGGALLLSLGREPETGGVRLEVSDSGSGIPEEALPHIYEPFYTTKEQGAGVGLGLSVVYGIVERHHGSVDVTSKVGEGTRFTVRLPRTQPPAAEEPAPDPEERR